MSTTVSGVAAGRGPAKKAAPIPNPLEEGLGLVEIVGVRQRDHMLDQGETVDPAKLEERIPIVQPRRPFPE